MSRPPVHASFGKFVGVSLLLAGLAILVGCQGVSAGGTQPPSGSLTFGSGSYVNFGSVHVGSSKTLTITATNSEAQSVTISSAAVSTKYFSLTSPSLPVTISAGQTATIGVKFAPTAVGTFYSEANVTSDATNAAATISLAGTGLSDGLMIDPASEAFGNVAVGAKQSQTVTLTNSSSSTVNISQASVSGAGFQLTGIAAPISLGANQSTTFTVAFAPQTTGTSNGSVTITSDDSNPTLSMSLSGTGVSVGALGSNPSSLSFGSVQLGKKQTLSETVTNTGGSSVTISQVGISGTGFSLSGTTAPVTLAAGQSASFSVSFSPTSAGAASGNVTVTSNASNPTLTIPLSGTGIAAGALGSNPSSLGFGSVQVGSKQTLSETVTNTGGSSVTISQVGASGTGFNLSGIAAPVTLTSGQSVTFSVSFTPASAGAASGNVTITSNASNPTLTIPLSGTGLAPGVLGSSPTSLSFGNVQVSNKQTLSETVTNNGGSSVTISQVGVSGSGFSVNGITAPVTLTSGQSATFSVSFTPPSAGAVSGNVTITSNASNPTLTIPLSGTGVTAGTLGANPTSVSFGNVQVSNKQTLSETVTNNGGSSVTISQVGVSGSGFSLSGITAPVTLTSGQSTTFSVSFTPPSAGTVSGNVTITSNASNPTLTIPLSGTGVTAGALGANPTSLSFGNVQVSNKQTLSETVTNNGGSSVTISQVGVSGSGFSLSGIAAPVTLTSGQSATFSVSFTPPSAGTVSGNVTITSNASNPTLTIPLSGTGVTAGTLGANPTSLSFGNVQVSNKQTLSETVTNNGGTSVTISQVGVSGSGFSLSGIAAPVTLTSGQSATFSVSFTPPSAGTVSGNVTITSNASNPTLTIPLSGTGVTAVGQLSVNPTTLALGSVVVGTSGTASGSLTASGASVTVTAASSNNSVFSVGGLSLPVTIAAGNSVPFTVTFSPLTTGAANATLTFTSNAQPSTTTEALTGTGTPAPTHTVNLSWTASTSSSISGYNIYRAVYTNSSCGSFSKVNAVLNTGTLYTDSVVVDGSSYCYAATAVDSSNEESGYSNIVSNLQIPPP